MISRGQGHIINEEEKKNDRKAIIFSSLFSFDINHREPKLTQDLPGIKTKVNKIYSKLPNFYCMLLKSIFF